MQFLGEEFDEKMCNKMCDNCKKNLEINSTDMKIEASRIISLVSASYLTIQQAIDILKGRKVKFDINRNVLEEHSGVLKHYDDDILRRLFIKLLLIGGLEENFVKKEGGSKIAITVHLAPGRISYNIFSKEKNILLSVGVKK